MEDNQKKSMGFCGTIKLIQKVLLKDYLIQNKINKFKDLKSLFDQNLNEEPIPVPLLAKEEASKIFEGLGINPSRQLNNSYLKKVKYEVTQLYKVFVKIEDSIKLAKLEKINIDNANSYFIITPANWNDVLLELFVKNPKSYPKERLISEKFSEMPTLLNDGNGPIYIQNKKGDFLKATEKTEKEILKRWKTLLLNQR